MTTTERRIRNGYRAAAAQAADALAMHKSQGNTEEVLIAYRLAALTMAAAFKLDRLESR